LTCRLKARIVEGEETSVARERLGKHASAATYARNNRRIVGSEKVRIFGAELDARQEPFNVEGEVTTKLEAAARRQRVKTN
jgi:hypothetical protein